MKLGADFNAALPTDGDFVRHPTSPSVAPVIRGIKTRLKEFFGTMFGLETGAFQDNVIPPTALIDSATLPAGSLNTFRTMTVDGRGFFVSGSSVVPITAPRIFRAGFTATEAWQETPDGVVRSSASALVPIPLGLRWNSTSYIPDGHIYEFIVPAGVTRLRVTLVGKGTLPQSPRSRTFGFSVTPNERLDAIAAGPSGVSYISTPSRSRWVSSEGLNVGAYPGAGPESSPTLGISRSPYYPFGSGSSAGLVLLEWYA